MTNYPPGPLPSKGRSPYSFTPNEQRTAPTLPGTSLTPPPMIGSQSNQFMPPPQQGQFITNPIQSGQNQQSDQDFLDSLFEQASRFKSRHDRYIFICISIAAQVLPCLFAFLAFFEQWNPLYLFIGTLSFMIIAILNILFWWLIPGHPGTSADNNFVKSPTTGLLSDPTQLSGSNPAEPTQMLEPDPLLGNLRPSIPPFGLVREPVNQETLPVPPQSGPLREPFDKVSLPLTQNPALPLQSEDENASLEPGNSDLQFRARTLSPVEDAYETKIASLQTEITSLREENERLQRSVPTFPSAPRKIRSVGLTPNSQEHISPNPIKKEASVRPEDVPLREPEDVSDLEVHPHLKLFPAQNSENNTLTDGWQIIGASRRGLAHGWAGKYREDDFNIRLVGQDIALIAIADGLGSKILSRHGARAAVLGATNYFSEQHLLNLANCVKSNIHDPHCLEDAKTLLLQALHHGQQDVYQRAREDGASVDDLDTTLMVFLVVPCGELRLFVASIQVGDGALFAYQPHKGTHQFSRWSFLQQPQIQPSGNEVQPLMHLPQDQWQWFFKCEWLDDACFIMGTTDGVANDIEPPLSNLEQHSADPFSSVQDFYDSRLHPILSHPQPEAALGETLAYRKIQSFDDRTLVCLYQPDLYRTS